MIFKINLTFTFPLRLLCSCVCVCVSETSLTFFFSFRVVWCVLHTSSWLDVTSSSSFDTHNSSRGNVPHLQKERLYSIHTHTPSGKKWNDMLTRQRPTTQSRFNIVRSTGWLWHWNFFFTTRWCCVWILSCFQRDHLNFCKSWFSYSFPPNNSVSDSLMMGRMQSSSRVKILLSLSAVLCRVVVMCMRLM